MPVDHIRYDILTQEALRGVVRKILIDARNGLPGDHHFFITFDPRAEGVRLSARMREQYPEEMTIVLQHQFWDLKVTDETFEVGLSFGGVAERLLVPFQSIKSFFDPSVQFGLQFETLTDAADDETDEQAAKAKKPKDKSGPVLLPAATSGVPAVPVAIPVAPAASGADDNTDPDKKGDKPGGEVVRLDRFRKK